MAEAITDNDILLKFLVDVLSSGNDCLGWMGSQKCHGYGSIQLGTGWREYAHRFIYKQVYGPIPTGCEIDHICGVTLCVNPHHLEAVPHSLNIARGKARRALERWAVRLGGLGVDVSTAYKRSNYRTSTIE